MLPPLISNPVANACIYSGILSGGACIVRVLFVDKMEWRHALTTAAIAAPFFSGISLAGSYFGPTAALALTGFAGSLLIGILSDEIKTEPLIKTIIWIAINTLIGITIYPSDLLIQP